MSQHRGLLLSLAHNLKLYHLSFSPDKYIKEHYSGHFLRKINLLYFCITLEARFSFSPAVQHLVATGQKCCCPKCRLTTWCTNTNPHTKVFLFFNSSLHRVMSYMVTHNRPAAWSSSVIHFRYNIIYHSKKNSLNVAVSSYGQYLSPYFQNTSFLSIFPIGSWVKRPYILYVQLWKLNLIFKWLTNCRRMPVYQ